MLTIKNRIHSAFDAQDGTVQIEPVHVEIQLDMVVTEALKFKVHTDDKILTDHKCFM